MQCDFLKGRGPGHASLQLQSLHVLHAASAIEGPLCTGSLRGEGGTAVGEACSPLFSCSQPNAGGRP